MTLNYKVIQRNIASAKRGTSKLRFEENIPIKNIINKAVAAVLLHSKSIAVAAIAIALIFIIFLIFLFLVFPVCVNSIAYNRYSKQNNSNNICHGFLLFVKYRLKYVDNTTQIG